MPETGPRHLETTVSPFDANGNFRDGGIRDLLNGTDTTDFIDSLHIAPASSGRGLSAVRTALYSIPAVVGMGAGAVLGVGGYHTGTAYADFDACPYRNGVVDIFPQPSIPSTDHDGGRINDLVNCVTNDTPPATGTPNGNDGTVIPTPHDVATSTPTATPTVFDACPRVNGVIDTFPQPTIPLALEDPDHDGNCTTRLTPPPTGTPNGTATPPPDLCLNLEGIQNPITPGYHQIPGTHDCELDFTPTPTTTATPTKTPVWTVTPTPTGTPEVCIGQLKIVKYHDRDESKTRNAGEEGLIWSFNVDEASTSQSPDFSITTNGDGTAIQTVRCGTFSVTEVAMQGWKETTTSPHQVVIGKNQRVDVLVGNVQLKPGETPTATPTRPAATPVIPEAGNGLANVDVTTPRGKFNFVAFAISTLVGISGSGMLFGRAIGRRKEEKAA